MDWLMHVTGTDEGPAADRPPHAVGLVRAVRSATRVGADWCGEVGRAGRPCDVQSLWAESWILRERFEWQSVGAESCAGISVNHTSRFVISMVYTDARDVTAAGWQVTLCDRIWHVSFHSTEASCKLLYFVYLLYLLIYKMPVQWLFLR